MINTLFYFADTEAEYLANVQNVASHTVVFCKDTNTIWKDGRKYGGDNTVVRIDEEASSVSYAINDSSTEHPTNETDWVSERPAGEQGRYLWTRDITAYTDGTHTITYGVVYFPLDGAGTAIDKNNTFVRYSNQKTQQRPAAESFTLSEPPSLEIGDWLWVLNRVTYEDGTPLDSYSVSRVGSDGAQGDPGSDGYTTHFAYSTSADGKNNFSTTNFSGASYIGTCRDNNENDPVTPESYVWTKWKGDNGQNGVSSYIHVKYSNDAGRTFTSNNGETPGYYMGQCVDNNVSAPNTPSSYTWALIKGEDGKEGTGINIKGAVESVSQLPSSGVVAGDAYMVSADLYVWTGSEWKNIGRIKGEKGDNQYIHIAWSTSADGSENFAVVKQAGIAYTYMGVCVDSESDDPQTYESYIWTLVKGDKGDKGDQGEQGPKGDDGLNGKDGVDGAPGTSTYFHVAYANKNTSGSIVDFSLDDLTDREYIGTYVDSTYADSESPAAYTWMLAKGAQGATGEQGIPGQNGVDGKTSYLHIKYSNDGRTFTANNGETPGYYLGQYVDFTLTDSTVFSKYKWALIKGLDGNDGKDGTGINIKGAVASDSQLPTSGQSAGDAYMVDKDLYVWTGSTWKNVGQIKGNDGKDGKDGINGTDGIDGVSSYLHIAYATSASGANFLTTHFSGATYIGIYVDSNVEDSESWLKYAWSLIKGEKGDKGDDGLNGKDGVDGADGTSSYFHVAYANKNASGTIINFSTSDPTNREYIGTYVDQNVSDSTDSSKYKWMLAKGAQGEDGEQGIPGLNGADGKTLYLHIKYSNDAGVHFTDNNGETPGYYLGQYVDFVEADSSTPSKYKWALIKGTDGTDGKDGTGVNIKGSVNSVNQLPTSGISAGDAYMVDKDLYVYTGSQWKNVGQIKGADGKDGTNGMDGKSAYLHIAYATSSNGTNFSTTHFSGATYIGMYTDSYVEDSEDWQDYVWSLIKGEKGDKGDKGNDGLNGRDGVDGAPGTSSYFHVAYANKNAGGTIVDFSTDNPEGREYIGTYVDLTLADSENPSKYTWMLAKGAQGENGEDGIPGQDGEDGKTSYLHIKYSNDAGSTFTANNGETPGYYLGQYVDFTQADSTNPSKYKWALIKGTDGTDGKDGTGVNIKGSVDNASQLPSSGVSAGDAYMVGKDLYIWTGSQWKNVGQIKGNDGKDGTNGINGTSAYLHIAYATSADGTQNFSTTSFTGATYIGICTDSAQADPETPSSYVWSLFKGEKGDKGDSITINTTASKVEYAIGNSGTVAPNSGWSTTVPSAQQGKYLWTRDTTVYSDGKSTVTYGVSYYGIDGTNGTNGVNGTSVTISSTAVTYQTSTSGTVTPTGTWSATIPTVSAGQYLWAKTVVKYSDNTTTTSYSVSRNGVNGQNGSSVIVSQTSVTYAVTKTATQPEDSKFTRNDIPELEAGDYLWSKEVITFSDNTSIKSYSVSRIGTDGETGQPGPNGSSTHFAYATSADGKTNFSTTMFNGATYVGTYTDTTVEDSTDYKKYIWTKLKGDKGDTGEQGPQGIQGEQGPKGDKGDTGDSGVGISSVTEYYLASSASSGVTRSTTGWSTSMQSTTTTNKYLWNYEAIKYSNNTTTYTTPVIIGTHGATGGDGKGVSAITEYYLASAQNTGITRSTTGWTTTIQSVTATKKYLWNYEKITYTYGDPTYTDPVIIGTYGDKGDQGDPGSSITIDSNNTYVRYSTVTNSSTQPADSTFSLTIPPTLANGSYLWILSRTTYSDGTSLKSYSVSRMGTDGDQGDPGADGYTTHFAYATSADGKTGFSTTNFNGATYIGTCRDKNEADPTTPGSYVWTRWKGDKGDDGSVFAYINENGLILESGSGDNLTEFNLSKDGLLQLRNAIIYGKLYSSEGTIGGLTLSGNSLYNGMTSLTDTTNNGVWLGTSGIALGKGAFKVTSDGSLTATRGTIGGFNIESTRLYSEDGAEIRLGSTASNWLSLSPSGILFSKRSGSAVNLTNALNANGSGSLASGNITWDANGNTKITGEITATKITLGTNATISAGKVTGLSDVATAGTFASLKEKPVIATKVSDLTNDSGFVDSSSLTTTLSSYATTTALNNGLSGKVATGDFTQANIIKKINNSNTSTTIDGGKITTGTISANQIATNAVTSDKIAANAITADKIAANSITASKINTAGLIAEGAEVFVNTGGSLSPGQMNGVSVKLNKEGVVVANIANSTSTVTNALYSDGSGKLASGNIVWDDSGNISKLKTVQGHFSSTFENGSATFVDDRMTAATIAIQGGTLTASDTTNGSSTVTISSDTVSASSGQITLSGNYTGKTTINGGGVHVYNGSTLKANISTEDGTITTKGGIKVDGTATLSRIKLGNADISYDSNRQTVFCDYGLATDGNVEAQGDLYAEGELSIEGTSTFKDTITAEQGVYVSGTLAINGGVSVTSGNTTKTGVTKSFKIKASGTYQGTSSDYDLTLTFTNGILTGYSTNGFPGETA